MARRPQCPANRAYLPAHLSRRHATIAPNPDWAQTGENATPAGQPPTPPTRTPPTTITSALANCRKEARHTHHNDDHVARQAEVPIAPNA
eukprot:6729731-Alexandrium_andersonii.AAC.1